MMVALFSNGLFSTLK